MDIKTKLTEKDFINVTFLLLYRRFFMKLMTAIGFLCLLSAVITKVIIINSSILSPIIYGVCMLVVVPAAMYFTAKKNYSSNKRISENIEYIFTPQHLRIIGESFNSELTWDKIYKVTKTKNWILIWQTNQIANAIPRRDLWDGELHTLEGLLQENNVRHNF